MGYYERGDFSDRVGPGTSAEWIERPCAALWRFCRRRGVHGVLSSRDGLGVPLPSVQFQRRVKRLHYKQARQMLLAPACSHMGRNFRVAFFRYEKDGRRHEVWYEDERSLGRKVEAARKAGVGCRSVSWRGAARP